MKELLQNMALSAIALVLAYYLIPLGLVVACLFLIFKFDKELTWKYFNRVFLYLAKSIDIFGNFVLAPLFNMTLIKKNESAYRFGKEGETISSALGKNVMAKNLTSAGKALNFLLNLFESDHSVKSINKNI